MERILTVSMPQMGQLSLAFANPLGVTNFLLMLLLMSGRLLSTLQKHPVHIHQCSTSLRDVIKTTAFLL
jgi:hypothetical protein